MWEEERRGDHRSDGGNQSGMKVADGVLQKVSSLPLLQTNMAAFWVSSLKNFFPADHEKSGIPRYGQVGAG